MEMLNCWTEHEKGMKTWWLPILHTISMPEHTAAIRKSLDVATIPESKGKIEGNTILYDFSTLFMCSIALSSRRSFLASILNGTTNNVIALVTNHSMS